LTKDFKSRVFLSATLPITMRPLGYCSTVRGLLDWFEVDLGVIMLLFTQIDLCVFVLYLPFALSSCPVVDILHCLARTVGDPLESALNLVGFMNCCGTHAIHIAVL